MSLIRGIEGVAGITVAVLMFALLEKIDHPAKFRKCTPGPSAAFEYG
jgi:hypothetical protein